jgi:hypothetical protein
VCQSDLARSQAALGDVVAARTMWEAALAIFDHLEHPDAEAVREQLRALTPAP